MSDSFIFIACVIIGWFAREAWYVFLSDLFWENDRRRFLKKK